MKCIAQHPCWIVAKPIHGFSTSTVWFTPNCHLPVAGIDRRPCRTIATPCHFLYESLHKANSHYPIKCIAQHPCWIVAKTHPWFLNFTLPDIVVHFVYLPSFLFIHIENSLTKIERIIFFTRVCTKQTLIIP